MFKVHKSSNFSGSLDKEYYYESVDVVWEDESGFEHICECGDWDNDGAQYYAHVIAELLNSNKAKRIS